MKRSLLERVKKSGKERKSFKINGLGADLRPSTAHRDCKVLKLKGLRIKPAGGAERACKSDQKNWAAGSAVRKATAWLPHSKKGRLVPNSYHSRSVPISLSLF
jgi:hypothetical protein